MSFNSNYEFHLPQIKRTQSNPSSKSQLYPQQNNILSRFEAQLKQKHHLQGKYKKKQTRLKTIDAIDHQQFDQFRKYLKSIKHEVSFAIEQQNHRLENKLQHLLLLSSIKNQPSQLMFQPIYLPSMHPSINHSRDYDSNHPYPDYSYPNYNQYKSKAFKKAKKVSQATLKKLRKYMFAVLFTVRLRNFMTKVINHKKKMFQNYLKDDNEFKEEANQIKKIFIQKMKPFLATLLKRQDAQLKLNDGDSENFKRQKILNTRKLIELLIDCLKKTVESSSFEAVIKSVYFFCRHGSPSPEFKLLTREQLENICISEKHFHLQAEKNLEKSQIINFLFMKILIYNALGQSWKIDSQKFAKDKEILQQNIEILTSILYELLMDIQDEFVINSPQSYKLNNYQQVKETKIYPSQSLSVKGGQYRKNQMISGLINEKIIKSTYKIQNTWVRQKNNLIEIIEAIHKKIVNYHKRFIKPFL